MPAWPSLAISAKAPLSSDQRAPKRCVSSTARPTATRRPPPGARPALTATKGRTITPPASICAGPAVTLSSFSPAALIATVKPTRFRPCTARFTAPTLTTPLDGVHESDTPKAVTAKIEVPAFDSVDVKARAPNH